MWRMTSLRVLSFPKGVIAQQNSVVRTLDKHNIEVYVKYW